MNTASKLLLVWATLTFVISANSGFSWNTLLSCALTIAVLALVVRASRAVGWRAVWIVFLIYFGIGWINTLDEAVLFQVLPMGIGFQTLVNGATLAFTIAVLLVLSLNRMGEITDSRRADMTAPRDKSWIWKMFAGGFLYFALYCIAGAAIQPFIRAFYANRKLPSVSELFVIEFFRGLLYIAVVLPLVRSLAVRKFQAAIVLGVCFSVLGGLAPLLLSNEYMPVSIRIAHSFEVGISNFVFGLLLGYLIIPRNSIRDSQSDMVPAQRL